MRQRSMGRTDHGVGEWTWTPEGVSQPYDINADHASTSRSHWARWFDALMGQWI